jgi:Ni2+-binding GTPase involved in maturation of urease and hydrogenase
MNDNIKTTHESGNARYIMIGGFLGAGKTTAVAALAARLVAAGERVGLITNDQGSELVDTATLRSKGFATEEIPGGCFCCRFNSLVDAAAKLDAASAPGVFIAEPVGSCTDLVATVTYPLRRMYGDRYAVAPLSVLVDPVRAERIFGLSPGGSFSEKVRYIYRKQLEEADCIVISKTDLLDAERIRCLRIRLAAEYPEAEIFAVSLRDGSGVEEWFNTIESGEQGTRRTMDVDYAIYAEGEALLGWLNATVQLACGGGFESDRVLMALATGIRDRLPAVEIAHLKMTLSPDEGLGDVAVVNLVRSDFVPELGISIEEPVESGQLIINLRAEADPQMLRDALGAALDALPGEFSSLSAILEHVESFRPGKPEPTHRFAAPTLS